MIHESVLFFFLREKKKEVYPTRSPQVFLATILVNSRIYLVSHRKVKTNQVNSRIYLVCLYLPMTGVQAIMGFLKFKA